MTPTLRDIAVAKPLVSVIIPTFDRRELLLRAIASVRAQTWTSWELIVVDDGSTDGSADAVRALSDDRIRLVRNATRLGGGFSRARGVGETRGSFIAYLDSDDYWLPTKLERQMLAVSIDGRSNLVVSGPMLVSAGGTPRPVWRPVPPPGIAMAELIYAGQGTPLQTSSLLLSGTLGRLVLFNPQLRVNQDTDFLLRLEKAGAALLYLNEPLYVHDISPRQDRVTSDPAVIDESMAWYHSVSSNWSLAAHRGYHLNDAAVRFARAGRWMCAFEYYYKGFVWSAGAYHLLRQLVLVLNRGQMPRGLGSLWRRFSTHQQAL